MGCSFIVFRSIYANEVSKCALLNSPHNSIMKFMIRQIIWKLWSPLEGGTYFFCSVYFNYLQWPLTCTPQTHPSHSYTCRLSCNNCIRHTGKHQIVPGIQRCLQITSQTHPSKSYPYRLSCNFFPTGFVCLFVCLFFFLSTSTIYNSLSHVCHKRTLHTHSLAGGVVVKGTSVYEVHQLYNIASPSHW